MAGQGSAPPENLFLSRKTLLLTTAFILPALVPGLFGWFYGLLAIPVFCMLMLTSPGQGKIIIRNSIVFAGATGIIYYQILPALLFSFTFIPLGYSLYASGKAHNNPTVAAGKGILVLILSWTVFWAAYGMSRNINPYTYLLMTMDSGLTQTYELYHQQANLTPDVLLSIEQLVKELKDLIPRILPGLLGCLAVLTVWINQTIGNSIILRLQPENVPWPKFSAWQIPEKFIWVAISAVIIILLGPGNIKNTGLSLGLICTLIYFFQGLAILVYLLSKWNVPGYFRIIIYMIIVVQSFGFIMLTILGLADVWLNLRKQQLQDQ